MSTKLSRLGIEPSWLLSSRLTSASSRSARIPVNRDVRLRYPKSKWILKICQALFLKKNAFLAHFSRYLLIRKYLEAGESLLRSSFVTETRNGVEVRREIRGIVAEEQPDADGNGEPDRDPEIRKRCGNRRDERAHGGRYSGADQNADGAADQREHHGFQQELQSHIRATRADGFAHANFLGALGHGNEHDVHHADATHEQAYRTDHGGENHERAGQLIPQIADEVRRGQLKIVLDTGGDAAEAPHRLNDFALRFVEIHVFRNGERHDQLFGLRVLFLESAERNDGKNIHAGTDKQTLIVREDADDFVRAAIDAHGFAEGVRVGEKGFAYGRAQDDHGAGVLLVKGADEAAALDAEERYGIDVLRLGAAHDDAFNAKVPAGDEIGIAEEKSARADGGQGLHVRRGVADVAGVIVFEIFARANTLRPAGGIRARRKSRNEVGARAERVDAVLYELVQPLNDRRHRNHRRNPDHDAEHGQRRAHFGGAQRLHGRKEIFAGLCKSHQGHQSDLKATTGSSRDARMAG